MTEAKKTRKKAAPKKDQELALNQKFLGEFKELLNNVNSRSDITGLYAAVSGWHDNNTLHNIYNDFGYPTSLKFENYFSMYDRFGPAKAVVDTVVNLCWLNAPKIQSKSERFEREVKALIKQTNLWNRVKGLDKRQRVGRYAGMLVEIKDGKRLDTEMTAQTSLKQIKNLKPIYEGQLRVQHIDQDEKSDEYGEPTLYNYNSTATGDTDKEDLKISADIHPSRLIMAAEGADDGSIFGTSVLKAPYNDLTDLQKISGAGGEGFYQNTRNAPVITADKEFKAPDTEAKRKELEEEMDGFLNKWRKKFVSKGLTFNYPNIKLDNPKEFADIAWSNIASSEGISSSELRGTQTGKLAGDKDNKSTGIKIQSRRENFLTELVHENIDWFIRYGFLEDAEYEVIWEDMTAATDDEKISVAVKMAETNSKQMQAGLKPVFSEDQIRLAAGHDPLEEEIEMLPKPPPPEDDFTNKMIANLKKKPEINAEDVDSLKDDPTKTLPIRKKWSSQFNVRYKKLKGRINRILLKGDDGDVKGQFVNPITLNEFEFTNDAQSVAEFMSWLQAQIDDLIYTSNATPMDIWQNDFIDDAYLRGIKRTDAEIRALGITAKQIEEARAAAIVGTATPSLASGVGVGIGTKAMPIHLEAIQLLYMREYQALKGVTGDMSKEIGRVLVEGVEQGLGVRDIAKLINDRVDKIGLTRSKLIARTETVRAYNIASVNEGDGLAKELGIKPMYEWVDSDDQRVRKKHRRWDKGGPYTSEEIMKKIGEPNCRCGTKLVLTDEDGNKI